MCFITLIADATKTAEGVANAVPEKEGEYSTRTRKRVRPALAKDWDCRSVGEIDGRMALSVGFGRALLRLATITPLPWANLAPSFSAQLFRRAVL